MNKITLASVAFGAIALTQMASGALVVAGWHSFNTTSDGTTPVTSSANEGIAGIYDVTGTRISHLTATASGGSTDNWYGPDSIANGGVKTNQTSFNDYGVYLYETTDLGGARLLSTYPTIDPFVATPAYAAQPGTTLNGRITTANSVDVYVKNLGAEPLVLQSFVFDAFLGDVSPADANAVFNAFTVTLYPTGGGTPVSEPLYATAAYSGYNTKGSPGLDKDQLLPSATAVPNVIDFGTGTNYVDFVLDLSGYTLGVGETIQIRFNQAGNGVVRLDNLALLAVPEPSSLLALGGLVGAGAFLRRRKTAPKA